MCRLLAVASSCPAGFAALLRDAPRSLAALSHEHQDGWGVAVHQSDWTLHKGVARAQHDAAFHERATASRGSVLVAHIRKKTVGPTRLENTHPFRRGPWVFAHNGTVDDVAHLRAASSGHRLREVEGDTDSELLFAYLLTRLDEVGRAEAEADAHTDGALRDVTRALARRRAFGSFNFLLSDGQTTYAHRTGRSLFVLERRAEGARPATDRPLVPRTPAVCVASERLTDEPWRELEEGALVRIETGPTPRVVSLT